MKNDNNQETFLALVKAGLWETEARLLLNEEVDYSELLRLAEEQSVVDTTAQYGDELFHRRVGIKVAI